MKQFIPISWLCMQVSSTHLTGSYLTLQVNTITLHQKGEEGSILFVHSLFMIVTQSCEVAMRSMPVHPIPTCCPYTNARAYFSILMDMQLLSAFMHTNTASLPADMIWPEHAHPGTQIHTIGMLKRYGHSHLTDAVPCWASACAAQGLLTSATGSSTAHLIFAPSRSTAAQYYRCAHLCKCMHM
jgi:hypothetical protein